MINRLTFCLVFSFAQACADDSQPIVEVDVDSHDLATTSDLGQAEVGEDAQPQDNSCRRDSDCRRGETCHVNFCAGASGCVFLTDFKPGVGCYFDHGLDFDEGLFSPTECAEDSVCTNPGEPNCIARICSRLTPCTEDDECESSRDCWRLL